ncbi:zinc transporter 1-like [Diaphorina citri]|uniref:Zinc transporter 1-like n=1 Tax=Diaphorina citri TaxID=121845 RepID=A0A3Q0IWT9_DIACI|nr:zinc transporter 1-like [Diaphorina citri]
MAIKDLFRKYHPLQMYIVLVLTICYFFVQLVVSHFTHALTLLVDSYHVLCNLIALFGCIASLKYKDNTERCMNSSSVKSSMESAETLKTQSDVKCNPSETRLRNTFGWARIDVLVMLIGCIFLASLCFSLMLEAAQTLGHIGQLCCNPSETRLRNTFGWARIDVLVMLIGCIFLASLCFSLMLEAAQTLGHISHHDEMHHPLQVLLVGAVGMILNGFCYLMIGVQATLQTNDQRWASCVDQGKFKSIFSDAHLNVQPTATKTDKKSAQKKIKTFCAQHSHRRPYMRNSTPILHLLKSTQTSHKRVRIQKAGSMSGNCSKSCVQLQLKDYYAGSNCTQAVLKRSLSADHVNSKSLPEEHLDRYATELAILFKRLHPPGCVIVMICSIIVYLTDASVAKYVDPILSIISALLLLLFSYPFMRDAGYILLQTIPNHIDIDSLCTELVEAFPNILNVHEIHVWQLTSNKTVSTAHIIFLNPQDYLCCTHQLIDFFYQQGISHVTIQPEFYEAGNKMDLISSKFGSTQCLIRCMNEECNSRNCCTLHSDQLIAIKIPDEVQPTATKTDKKSAQILSNDWVIKIGRGLDIFCHVPEFSIGFTDLSLRPSP